MKKGTGEWGMSEMIDLNDQNDQYEDFVYTSLTNRRA